IAITIKSKGKVKVYESGKKSDKKLKRGFRLKDGDKIVTGDKSYAAFRFIDDRSLVRVRANSSCTIQGKEEDNSIFKNIFLEIGTIFARITKQKGRFQVTTPTSVASVKGTKFITDHRGADGTYYFGEEGLCEIKNKGGVARLRSGETAFVADENTAPVVYKTRKGEKPSFEEFEGEEDEFEFEFENDAGDKKLLKFKAQKKD
ncbi:MAG: FecR domain-containing protein, partial [Calditrichia bacterium]|nr:FecR domain-containing protein [Calditrichia bacterium]